MKTKTYSIKFTNENGNLEKDRWSVQMSKAACKRQWIQENRNSKFLSIIQVGA